MANTFSVTDMVAKEVQRIAHEKLTFIGTIDRQYDSSFSSTGGKHGSTLRVKKPNQYTRRTGSRVMNVQDQNEASQTITVATQDGVDMRFNSAELIQSVNNGAAFNDLSKNYIEPAVSALVSGIEADMLAFATKATFNQVGTANTAITTLATPGAARAKLNQGLAPKDSRNVQMDSVAMGTLVGTTLAGYFNPTADISKQYREGMVSRTAMADWYENERVYALTTGSDHTTVTVNATSAATDGGNIITISGGTVTVGDVFTVAGVYACHPETKASLGYLQQFVVTGGTLTAAVTVSPSTYWTGARKNICTSTGADVAVSTFNSAVVTVDGDASSSYSLPLMYHPEAFQFVTADLPLMDDALKCVRINQDGLNIRVWQGSDIRNDELLMRVDILYGMAALRPEWACRMIGAKGA